MYADDTTLFCDINNIQNLEITLNAELLKVTDWLAANKLSLNASKTKFMVFHSDKKIVRYPKLFINDVKIERVDCFNFLGLQLNHNLKWNKHISHVSLKITKITGLLHKLHKQQKRAIRNVTKSDYRAHTEPLCKEHNLLKVHDIYYLAVLKFYSKLVNNNLLHYFSSVTPQFSAGQQNYNLQNPTMQLPRIKHEFPKQSLRYKLITTLNITPNETIEVAKTQSQQNLINLARANILNGYSATCNLLICNVCTK